MSSVCGYLSWTERTARPSLVGTVFVSIVVSRKWVPIVYVDVALDALPGVGFGNDFSIEGCGSMRHLGDW